MKHSLAFFCLAMLASACSSSPSDLSQAAVAGYLKKTLDDPASYQSIRWSKPTPWRQHNADSSAAAGKMLSMMPDYAHAQSFLDSCKSGALFSNEDTVSQGRAKRSGVAAGQRLDKNLVELNRLKASKDTTRIGVTLWHSFRSKNKMGALVLDSARFIVSKAGVVTVL